MVQKFVALKFTDEFALLLANIACDTFRASTSSQAKLEASQPAKLVPISREALKSLMRESGYEHVPAQEKADFIAGFRHAEAHHSKGVV